MFHKKGTKFRYKVTFVSGSGFADGSFVSLGWKRGTKSSNQGELRQKQAVSGKIDWNETVSMMCTLFRSGAAFEEKNMVITLSEVC
jgi:hypothetical protein